MNLTVTGLKAHDISIDLGEHTLLRGRNGVGKSTVMDALRFLALGFVPSLGKRPLDTATLLRDREARVHLTLPDGRWCARVIERKAKGVATRCTASWVPDAATQEEHHEAIRSLFGDSEETVAECLDLRVLLAASDNQRVARLTALLESANDAIDPAVTIMSITRHSVQQLSGVGDDRMPPAVADVCPLVPGFSKDGSHSGQYAVLKVAMATLKGIVEGSGGLTAATAHANETKNSRIAEIRNKTAARKELEDRVEGVAVITDEELNALDMQRAQIEQNVGAQRERLTAFRGRQKNVTEATSKLQMARTVATAAQEERTAVEAKLPEMGNMRARLAEVEAELGQATVVPPPDEGPANELERKADEIEAPVARMRAEKPAIVDLDPYERGIEDLKTKIKAAEADPWSEVDTIGARIEAEAKGSSARIVSIRADAARLRELAQANGGCAAAILTSQMLAAEAEAKRVAEHAEKIHEQRSAIEAKCVHLEQQATQLYHNAKSLREQIRRDYTKATREAFTKGQALKSEAAMLKASIAAIEQRDRRSTERLNEALLELQAAERRIADLGELPEVETPQEEDLVPQLYAVQRQIADAQASRQMRSQFSAIIAELEKAETEATVWKAVEAACVRTRNEQIAEQGGPLLERMRTFFTAAGRTERPFLRASKAECAIGWERGGKEIQIESMSGGEWALYVAALVAAMLALRAAPVRVLLVEAGELDDANATALLRGIAAVGDDLTYAIVCRPEAPSTTVSGWDVTTPTSGGARAAA